MNDKERATQRKRIRTLRDRWHAYLGLQPWEITYVYTDGDFESNVLATTKVEGQYLRAGIDWNLRSAEQQSDAELEFAVVHELMHVMVNDLRRFRSDGKTEAILDEVERFNEERVCTALARAFINTRDKSQTRRVIMGDPS